jgi:hypothetical protein
MYAQAIETAYHRPTIDRDRHAQLHLYQRALDQGRRGQLWSMLTGRARCLFDLASVEASHKVHGRYEAGLQTVSIEQIQGSEGRAQDYDRDFRPLKHHTRERWLSVARARKQGRSLPPVALIQVGDIYFVQDGHHRISVARALGQKDIEASVIVWQVEGPLSWETSARAPAQEAAGQPNRIKRTLKQGLRLVTALGW